MNGYDLTEYEGNNGENAARRLIRTAIGDIVQGIYDLQTMATDGEITEALEQMDSLIAEIHERTNDLNPNERV